VEGADVAVTEARAESVIFRPRMPTPVQTVATARPAVLVPMVGSSRKETQVTQQMAAGSSASALPHGECSKKALLAVLSQTRSFDSLLAKYDVPNLTLGRCIGSFLLSIPRTSLFNPLPEVRDDFTVSSKRSPASRDDHGSCWDFILDTDDSPTAHFTACWAACLARPSWETISSDHRRWRVYCRWHHISRCSPQTPAAQVL
jgi:hypothetical protein